MKVISDQGKFVQKAQVTITLGEAVNRPNTLVRLGHQTSRTDEEDYPGLSPPKDGSMVSGQEQELATAEVTKSEKEKIEENSEKACLQIHNSIPDSL